MTGKFFFQKWHQVGSLPSIPIFIEYCVPADYTELQLLVVEGADGTSSTTQVLPPPPKTDQATVFCDAFRLREAFDQVANPSEMNEFLRFCGAFRTPALYGDGSEAFKRALTVSYPQFQEWQRYMRDLRLYGFEDAVPDMSLTAEELMGFQMNRNWRIANEHPSGKTATTAYVFCSSAIEAIAGTIAAEAAMNVEWRECEYSYCKTPQRLFRLGRNKIPQRFCDRVCKEGHKQQRRRGSGRTKGSPAVKA